MARLSVTWGNPRLTVRYPAVAAELAKLLAADLSGTFDLAPGLEQEHRIAALMDGVGAFAGGPLVTAVFNLEATLNATGVLSVDLNQSQGLAAQVTATAALSANAIQEHPLDLNIFALSQVTADIETAVLLGAAMSATSDLSVDLEPPPTSNDMQVASLAYTGSGGTQAITGAGFTPDLVIILNRFSSSNLVTYIGDSVSLGVGKLWAAASDDSLFGEFTINDSNSITSYDADGFTLGSSSRVNDSSKFYLAICLKGGDQFEVIDKTNNGATGQVVAHNLASAPIWAFIKQAGEKAGEWITPWTLGGQSAVGLGENKGSETEAVKATSASDITLGNVDEWNPNDTESVPLYLFGDTAISGSYATGTYTGNNSAGNAITGLGFKPHIVMIRSTDFESVFLISDDLIGDTVYDVLAGSRDAGFSLDADGFSVDAGDVNLNNIDYRYFAWA
jgi:hypothetical protein